MTSTDTPPDTPGTASPGTRRLILSALTIDALGSGVWLPFALIFFTKAQGQSLETAGLAMTVGSLLGLIVGQFSGGVIDRFGPHRLILISNLVRALTFAVYPLVGSAWQMVLVIFLVFAADRVFWSANVPFVSTVVSGRGLDRFLGTAGMLQMIGMGAGAALGGFAAGSITGLHLIAWGNAASFAVAAVLILLVRDAGAPVTEEPEQDQVRGSVWRDTAYLQLCLTQVVFVLAGSAFVIILPLVALDVFGGPGWLPGISIVVGNIALALLQKPVLAAASRRSRASMLLVSVPFYVVAFLALAAGDRSWGFGVVLLVLGAAVLGAVAEVLANALMLAAANDAAPPHQKGRYSAAFQTGWGLAEAVAPLLFAFLLTRGNPVLWLSLAAFTLLAVPLLLTVRHRLPAQALLNGAEA